MSTETFNRIKEKIEYQIEDIMNAENIDRKNSIKYLKSCVESRDSTIFNVSSFLNVLESIKYTV